MSERSRFYPKILKSQGARIGFTLTTLKLEEIKGSFDYTSKYKDFEETRKDDVFIFQPATYELEFNYVSDVRKRINFRSGIEYSSGINEQFDENFNEIQLDLYSLFRVSDKFKIELGISNGFKQ